METNNNPIYMYFHIGRGNMFNNPGTVTFRGECDLQYLIARRSDIVSIISEDEDGNQLPDNAWKLIQDASGHMLLKGREAIEAKTGVLDFDGEYDTDYVITADKMSDKELDAAYHAYIMEEYMSEELKDTICEMKGEKRFHHIKVCYPRYIMVNTQKGTENIDIYKKEGELTRKQWNDDLCERGLCPLTIERILHVIELSNTEFFKED